MTDENTSSELADILSDAIEDSFDMDWNGRDGAKACILALQEEGILLSAIDRQEALQICRRLPLHGDAGLDKLADDEWLMVIDVIAALRQPDQNKTPVPELVERIYAKASVCSTAQNYCYNQALLDEAATALTTLAAENERLREALEEIRTLLGGSNQEFQSDQKAKENLQEAWDISDIALAKLDQAMGEG